VASPAESTLDDAITLVRACAAGDAAARRRFQDRFAEDIYNFPIKIYGLPAEKAGDFYVYAFERDRIFTRLKTFEGRGGIQLRTFLAYHVLRALFLDWQRGDRELDTVSLSTPLGGEGGGATLEDVLAAPDDDPDDVREADPGAGALWESLAPEERLDLKLLSLLEHEPTPDDVRLLAKISKRSVEETLAVLAEVQAELRVKDARVAELSADLDSAWGWLVLRRKELQETTEKLRQMEPEPDSAARQRLAERQQELRNAIEKRSQQHARTLEELRDYKVTTSYKDIARLKNSTVGTVCSRIFRIRQRLEARLAAGEDQP
jgi:RNA polymerase sigma factor (sigma-70 family)